MQPIIHRKLFSSISWHLSSRFCTIMLSIKGSVHDEHCGNHVTQIISLSLHSHLGGRSYGSHFPNKETETWRGYITRLGSHSSNMQWVITNPYIQQERHITFLIFFWTHFCMFLYYLSKMCFRWTFFGKDLLLPTKNCKLTLCPKILFIWFFFFEILLIYF